MGAILVVFMVVSMTACKPPDRLAQAEAKNTSVEASVLAIETNHPQQTPVQNATTPRKPIAESKLKLPDYFGFYAVLKTGELIVLDQDYTTPLPADIEFLEYADRIDSDKYIRDAETEKVTTKLLKKPVTNQSQMLRFIPAEVLPDGVYTISRYQFVVGNLAYRPVSEHDRQRAINICEVEKAKVVLQLPVGVVTGGMDATTNTVISSGEGLNNLFKALRITGFSELAVEGNEIVIGDMNTRAHY
jgi:hypothetical protein